MREIGSEFWDVPVTEQENALFPESAQWFLSGRSALQAIVQELGRAKRVALPSWCCESMILPFLKANFDIQFYPVYRKSGLVQELPDDCDVLFLMNYFGYTSSAPDLSGYKGVVIRDVTHSVFSTSFTDSGYYFGSLRKWCGVWTGGFAWTDDGHRLMTEDKDISKYVCLRANAMERKQKYLNGESKGDKRYLEIFENAETYLECVGAESAASRDVEIAGRIDVDLIRRRRRENAEILRKAFPEFLIFPEMCTTDCPMFVPVCIPNGKRDALRRFLIQNAIYCPVHWPVSVYHQLDGQTKEIYQNELSLVCDQRYTVDDMYWMVEMIQRFMERS